MISELGLDKRVEGGGAIDVDDVFSSSVLTSSKTGAKKPKKLTGGTPPAGGQSSLVGSDLFVVEEDDQGKKTSAEMVNYDWICWGKSQKVQLAGVFSWAKFRT